jgi:hypothetical protein
MIARVTAAAARLFPPRARKVYRVPPAVEATAAYWLCPGTSLTISPDISALAGTRTHWFAHAGLVGSRRNCPGTRLPRRRGDETNSHALWQLLALGRSYRSQSLGYEGLTVHTVKVAFVTGAGGGIRRAAALAFAREGASLVVADVSEKDNQETARMIEEQGGRAIGVRCDVTRRRGREGGAGDRRDLRVFGFRIQKPGLSRGSRLLPRTTTWRRNTKHSSVDVRSAN